MMSLIIYRQTSIKKANKILFKIKKTFYNIIINDANTSGLLCVYALVTHFLS